MEHRHRTTRCPRRFVPGGIWLLACLTALPSSAQERFHISGYGNAHSMDHHGLPRLVGRDDPNDLFFQLREFSLFLDFEVSEGILASVEIEAGDNAETFTPNYAYVNLDLPAIFEGWDSDRTGEVNVRIGKFLVPFLSYNENKPNFKQQLMSQPFTAWVLAPVIPSPPDFKGLGWSDVGILFDWTRELGDAGLLDLKLSLINGLGSDEPVLDANFIQLDGGPQPLVRPRDGLIQNEGDDVRDNNSDKAVTAKLSFALSATPLNFGFSFYRGAWDKEGMEQLEMRGFHLNWLNRSWTLKGEYGMADVAQTAGLVPAELLAQAEALGAPAPPFNQSTGDYEMTAWYAEASYIPWHYGSNAQRFLRLILRADEADTNDQAMFTPFDRSRLTYGVEWEFASRIRLRYEFQRHELNDFQNAPPPFRLAGGEERVEMHMASIIFWF